MSGIISHMGRLKQLPPRVRPMDASLRLLPDEREKQRHRIRDKRDAWRGWYKTARWQALKVEVHVRDGYICRRCPVPHAVVGRYPAANSPVADHIVPHHGDETLFWDKSNVQTVCKAYHDSEKQAMERAGKA